MRCSALPGCRSPALPAHTGHRTGRVDACDWFYRRSTTVSQNRSKEGRRRVPGASPEESEKVIQDVMTLYRQGKSIVDEIANAADRVTILSLAVKWDRKANELTFARNFATRYTPKQVDRLCGKIRKGQSSFGMSHLGILVTVSEVKVRGKLETMCIKKKWSLSQLKAAKAEHCKVDSSRGRPPRVLKGNLVFLLHKNANRFCRLVESADRAAEGPSTFLEGLPPEVARVVKEAYAQMKALRKETQAHLGGRGKRS